MKMSGIRGPYSLAKVGSIFAMDLLHYCAICKLGQRLTVCTAVLIFCIVLAQKPGQGKGSL